MKEVVKTEEKKFDLKEAFHLFKNEGKNGVYLKGVDCNGNKLVGFINTDKKNPNEPDIRVNSIKPDGSIEREVASLWDTVSLKENRYLTGSTDVKEKLIAFYGYSEVEESNRPYIKAYFKD